MDYENLFYYSVSMVKNFDLPSKHNFLPICVPQLEKSSAGMYCYRSRHCFQPG